MTAAASGTSGHGTVGKALEVLDLVAAHGRPMRFTEMQNQSPFPKATLYRFVQTLTGLGMLSYDPDRQTYSPGIRLMRLAHASWAQSSLAPIARPHLDALARDLGETVHLAQLDGGHVLYIDKRNAIERVEMYSSAGKVGPAYCTGVGKAILAFLPDSDLEAVIAQQSFHAFTDTTLTSPEALREELVEVRDTGLSFDREEHEPGIICIAVPILTETGRPLGALSVTSTTKQRSLRDLGAIAPRVRLAAQTIAEDARAWRFPDEPSTPQSRRTG